MFRMPVVMVMVMVIMVMAMMMTMMMDMRMMPQGSMTFMAMIMAGIYEAHLCIAVLCCQVQG